MKTLAIELRKGKRTGVIPVLLAVGVLGAAYAFVNFIVRKDTLLNLPLAPMDVLLTQLYGMIMVLNLFGIVVATCMMGVLAGKGSGTPPFCNGVCHAPGAYPATVTAWQTAGGQGKLHFPYAALRQLPLCELVGSEHLAAQAIHFPQV